MGKAFALEEKCRRIWLKIYHSLLPSILTYLEALIGGSQPFLSPNHSNSLKSEMPMPSLAMLIPYICYPSILCWSYGIQRVKRLFYSRITTPSIFPKCYLLWLTTLNEIFLSNFCQLLLMAFCNPNKTIYIFLGAPTILLLPIFLGDTHL